MPKSSLGQELGAWDSLARTIEKRAGELSHLAEQRALLAEVVAQVTDLKARLAVDTGRLRTTARELREVRRLGRELESRLRAGLRQHFGAHAAALVGFGGRPLRLPRRSPVPSVDRPPVKAAAESGAEQGAAGPKRATPAPEGPRLPRKGRTDSKRAASAPKGPRQPRKGQGSPKRATAAPKGPARPRKGHAGP